MASEQYGTDPHDVYDVVCQRNIEAILKNSGSPLGTTHNHEPHTKLDRGTGEILPVAIIGAGIGGLYTAMILQSLNIPFKVIEASGRTGGRILTHRFSDDPAQYYDVGAMRFPIGLPIMSRLKKLFEHDDIKGNINLIEYKFNTDGDMGYLHYNGIRSRKKDHVDHSKDIFNFQQVGVPPAYHNPHPSDRAGYDNIVKDVRKDYVAALAADIQNGGDAGWKKLMEKDRYSTRTYMSLDYKPSPELQLGDIVGLPNDVINWCETMSGSTGTYDAAFSQTVLGAMAFGATDPPPVPNWTCINGGSSKLIDAMVLALKSDPPIVLNTPVTAIGLTKPELGLDSMMTVEYSGDKPPEQFSHVISTLPLPILRTLDLSKSNLTLYQQNALRQLEYKDSVKIGVQFKSAWWKNGKDKSGNDVGIVGGQSFTDMPIRTVVYPSYGLDRSPTEPAVLIASYTTTEDAERFAALIVQFDSSKFDPTNPLSSPLASLVLKNLAEVHNVELSFLASQVMAIHPWDWNAAPYAMGAAALFGPGDFENLYCHMTRPAASGRLHFAGDTISSRHAWVVGALDSAWRAVDELLRLSAVWNPKLGDFHHKWGFSRNWVTLKGITTADGCDEPESVPSSKCDAHMNYLCVTCPELYLAD